MKRLIPFVAFLCLLASCKKEDLQQSDNTAGIDRPKNNHPNDSKGQFKVIDQLSLIPLVDNGDGSWTGNFGGMRIRFADFMYEQHYDGNGNLLPPKNGEPCWPYTIGPEPGVTTPGNFSCLVFSLNINSPNNQLVAQNTCQYYGSIYVPGNGMTSYWNAVDNAWTVYQNQMYTWYATLMWNPTAPRPTVPQTPNILTYLQQDYLPSAPIPLVFTARFGIIYNSSTGQVSFGIDAR